MSGIVVGGFAGGRLEHAAAPVAAATAPRNCRRVTSRGSRSSGEVSRNLMGARGATGYRGASARSWVGEPHPARKNREAAESDAHAQGVERGQRDDVEDRDRGGDGAVARGTD